MNFGESLASIMIERDVSSQILAANLGVSVVSVNRWKTGKINIALSYLVMLCQCFECSLDYLLGRTDTNIKPRRFEINNFGTQVRNVMKSKGITTYQLQNETRYSGGYFYDWDNGADPKLSTLFELANYFKCSLDELVGLE